MNRLLSSALLALLLAAPASAGELRVRVHGLTGSEGHVRLAVWDGQAAFDADAPVAGVFVPARAGGVVLALPLPPGSYGISAYHDRNANAELDTNLVGMPSEPFGFSNDARGRFGPPGFEQMSFSVGEEPVALEIELR